MEVFRFNFQVVDLLGGKKSYGAIGPLLKSPNHWLVPVLIPVQGYLSELENQKFLIQVPIRNYWGKCLLRSN